MSKHRIYVTPVSETPEHCELTLGINYDVDYGEFVIPAGTLLKFKLEGENGWPEVFYNNEWLDWADPISDYEVTFINEGAGIIK